MWHILLIKIVSVAIVSVLVGILVDVLDVFVIGMVYFLHEMELLVFGKMTSTNPSTEQGKLK